MKKLIKIVIVAVVMLGSFVGNAQETINSSNKKQVLDATFTYLVQTSKVYYKKGMSEKDFVVALTGTTKMSKEGYALMRAIYKAQNGGNNYRSKTSSNPIEDYIKSGNSNEFDKTTTSKRKGKWWIKLLIKLLQALVDSL